MVIEFGFKIIAISRLSILVVGDGDDRVYHYIGSNAKDNITCMCRTRFFPQDFGSSKAPASRKDSRSSGPLRR